MDQLDSIFKMFEMVSDRTRLFDILKHWDFSTNDIDRVTYFKQYMEKYFNYMEAYNFGGLVSKCKNNPLYLDYVLFEYGQKKRGLKYMFARLEVINYDLRLLQIYYNLYLEYRKDKSNDYYMFSFKKLSEPTIEFVKTMLGYVLYDNREKKEELEKMYDWLFDLIQLEKNEEAFLKWAKFNNLTLEYYNGCCVAESLFLTHYSGWTNEMFVNKVVNYDKTDTYKVQLMRYYLNTLNGAIASFGKNYSVLRKEFMESRCKLIPTDINCDQWMTEYNSKSNEEDI